MLIKRIIIQDYHKICILNNHLNPHCTVEEIKTMLKKEKIGHYDIEIDTVGVALVTTYQALRFG